MLVLRLNKCIFKNIKIHKCQITAWGIATTVRKFSSSMFVVPWGFFILNCKSFLSHLWWGQQWYFLCVNKKQTVFQSEFYAMLFGGYVSSSSTNVQVCQPVCEKRIYRNIRLKKKNKVCRSSWMYWSWCKTMCCRLASWFIDLIVAL